MLCCLAEIGMLVFGIVVLATGKIKVSSDRVVLGAPARVIGAILLLPFVLGTGGEFLMGVYIGIQQATSRQPLSPAEIQQKMQTPALILHLAVFVVTFIAAFVIAFAYGGRPDRGQRDFYYGDDPAGPYPGGGPSAGPPGEPDNPFRRR